MDNIARVIEMWTKIPASKIKEEEFKRLAELDQRLRAHVVGQDEAIAAATARASHPSTSRLASSSWDPPPWVRRSW